MPAVGSNPYSLDGVNTRRTLAYLHTDAPVEGFVRLFVRDQSHFAESGRDTIGATFRFCDQHVAVGVGGYEPDVGHTVGYCGVYWFD
ncbi:MAG: hypothetical protein BWY82_02047 [Verrucomicrobia bacterium ADurb.Bin474]|nr:MAG: hypothetical protein BWY82_02047 [Verrucomicrobia bacterium ADurb.Bin474]